MFEFWIIFIFQVLLGNVDGGQISAIRSETPIPQITEYLEWPCGEETCFISWRTGP